MSPDQNEIAPVDNIWNIPAIVSNFTKDLYV